MARRILGVDYGTRRTGLAVGDEELRVASPLEVIEARDRQALAETIARLAQQEGVDRIVVGLPLNMDGSEGPMAAACRALADELHHLTGLAVDLFDERLTTHAAEGRLAGHGFTQRQRRRRVDALAAMLLLQSYLDRLSR